MFEQVHNLIAWDIANRPGHVWTCSWSEVDMFEHPCGQFVCSGVVLVSLLVREGSAGIFASVHGHVQTCVHVGVKTCGRV